jgi:hypothetical protein
MAKRSRSTTPAGVIAEAVEAAAVDFAVDAGVEEEDMVDAHSVVEVAVDTTVAEEVAVEVAVSVAVVDAAAEVVEVEDAEAATTVTKMATLLENVLRDVTMEATTTVIRHKKNLLGILMTKNNQKKSRKKPSLNHLEIFLSIQDCLVQYTYNYH